MDNSLNLFKNKEEHEQSANASQEVKEHLANFIFQRQGSSTQISSIQSASSSCVGGNKTGQNYSNLNLKSSLTNNNGLNETNNNGLSNNNGPQLPGNHYDQNNHDCCMIDNNLNDDHPLRKTASMPTMHIPYKAQSLSRRRQMERRTTVSPLIKRQSRPRRKVLLSQDSNLTTEYSSNPCITSQFSGSLSQSSSPPSSQPNKSALGAKPSKLMNSSCSSKEAGLRNPLNYPAASAGQQNSSSSPSTSLLSLHQAASTSGGGANHPASTNVPLALDNSLAMRQKQHQQVNEALRKTIINRAPSRGRLIIGGSLDTDNLSSTMMGGSEAASTFNNAQANDNSSNNNLNLTNSARLELRQWSLDGADIDTCSTLKRLASPKLAAQVGYSKQNANPIQREIYKFRLAGQSDVGALRRSQSPSSSISMGLPGPIQQQQYPAHQNAARESRFGGLGQQHAHLKHHSSSSSSTSSLISQQDSLEDSSSRAIDLSSSAESSRARHYQQQALNYNQPTGSGQQAFRQQLHHQLIKNNSSSTHKVLLDSFNQLQLCQSQDQQMKQLILGGVNSRSTAPANRYQHHPPLASAPKTALSLDATGYGNSPLTALLTGNR